ncbi:MAG: ribosomal protein S18-alanine N-acetyltransferase [Candidatus Thermoplasmatota archaeon]|nr:ribosomal protein S18-alanine N-acetyltransferase [Candidatus Thermoplasmatota archaeon]
MIRKCIEEDIPQVVEIERLSFKHPYPAFVFKKYLRARFLVYEEKEKIVGYIIGIKMGSKGMIMSLAVHPSFRRKGYGRELVEAITKMLDANIVEIQVRRSNLNALKFYRSIGFERKNIIPAYYSDGEDAIIMIMKTDR